VPLLARRSLTLADVKSRRSRAVAWVKDDPFGVEFAEIDLETRRLSSDGVAVGVEPFPYRLDYSSANRARLHHVAVARQQSGQGWCRAVDLTRAPDGTWDISADEQGDTDLPSAGGDPATLRGALDCDRALSPVTNLMPVLRHDLLLAGCPVELTMASISVPALSVHADHQRYSFVRSDRGRRVIRYEASDGTFAADITLDEEGIVVDSPASRGDSN
jgi:uncharacterized protein